MYKSEARKIFIQKRQETTFQQRAKWDDLILIKFQTLSMGDIHTLFTYAPMDTEVNTDTIVDYLWFQNPSLRVAYPVCDFVQYTMHAALVSNETLFVNNKYGTPEPDSAQFIAPESIDVVIVPLLCFDKNGYRVGYGKGFYDKYLKLTRSDTIKIGLSYYEPIDKIIDRNEFDVPLNYCITPERMYEF